MSEFYYPVQYSCNSFWLINMFMHSTTIVIVLVIVEQAGSMAMAKGNNIYSCFFRCCSSSFDRTTLTKKNLNTSASNKFMREWRPNWWTISSYKQNTANAGRRNFRRRETSAVSIRRLYKEYTFFFRKKSWNIPFVIYFVSIFWKIACFDCLKLAKIYNILTSSPGSSKRL